MDYARLDRDKLEKLYQLEEELGSWIIAVQPPAAPSELTEEQLYSLKSVEDDLGVVLLAYKPAPMQKAARPRRRSG